METVFLHLLNNGINAGWLVLAVLLLRFFLKKLQKLKTCQIFHFFLLAPLLDAIKTKLKLPQFRKLAELKRLPLARKQGRL